MDLLSEWSRVCLVGHLPSICCGINFNVGNDVQTFQPNCFIPTMFIGTIDF